MKASHRYRYVLQAPRTPRETLTQVGLLVVAAVLLALGLPARLFTLKPAAASHPPASNAKTGGPGIATVIIGDSHAWLWAIHQPTVPDLGVPGATSAQIAAQLPVALALHPRFVVISAGTNDLVQGSGAPAVAITIARMVREVRAGGATPVLLLLPHYGTQMQTGPWAGLQIWSAPGVTSTIALSGADQVSELNKAILALGTPVLEAPAGQSFDGLHLDAGAYTQLNQQLAAITGTGAGH